MGALELTRHNLKYFACIHCSRDQRVEGVSDVWPTVGQWGPWLCFSSAKNSVPDIADRAWVTHDDDG